MFDKGPFSELGGLIPLSLFYIPIITFVASYYYYSQSNSIGYIIWKSELELTVMPISMSLTLFLMIIVLYSLISTFELHSADLNGCSSIYISFFNVSHLMSIVSIYGLIDIVFAAGCSVFGVVYSPEPKSDFRDTATCLYFSTISITTTGFGDFIPSAPFRKLVAYEPLTGIIVSGCFLASLVRSLSGSKG